MKRDAELKRAASLIKQLGAVTGNERLLSPEQLVCLREWRMRRSATGMTDEQLAAMYEASLDANYVDPDALRPDIQAILNANVPVIYKSDTHDEAAEKYYQYSQNN